MANKQLCHRNVSISSRMALTYDRNRVAMLWPNKTFPRSNVTAITIAVRVVNETGRDNGKTVLTTIFALLCHRLFFFS